jgi:ABC-type multidrug transport system fused ATPase/permease subunit
MLGEHTYEKHKLYPFSEWSSKLYAGKDEVIKWQWTLISPLVFTIVGIFILLTIIDWVTVLPVRLFFHLTDTFESTITDDNPKGNRLLGAITVLSIGLTAPFVIWAIPNILHRIITDKSSKRTRREWDRLERERNRRREARDNHGPRCVCVNCYEGTMASVGIIPGNVPERQFRRDTGSSYIDDMVTSNVMKHKL